MKFELTAKDQKDIKDMLTGPHALYLKKFKEQKFEVGDILVHRTLEFKDYECKEIAEDYTEKYTHSNVDIRYVVIHKEEETNYCILRAIKDNGKMNKERIYSTYSPDDHVGYRSVSFFETDPRTVDAIILNEEFDLSSILKEEEKRKNRLVDMNRNSCKVFHSLKEVNSWAKNLKSGQQVYYHDCSDYGFLSNSYVTINLKKDPRRIGMNEFTQQEYYDRKLRNGNYTKSLHKTDNCVYMLATRNEGAKITTADLLGKALYLDKPIDLKGEQ